MQSPYEPAPPPDPIQVRKRKNRELAIVLGAVGCLGALLIGLPFAVGVGLGVRNALKSRVPAQDPRTVPLTQVSSSPNGLLTARYPADFAMNAIDNATIVLSRNVSTTENELVALAAVPHPITNDVREMARLFEASTEKLVLAKGGSYAPGRQTVARCLGGRTGWQVETSYTLPLGGAYVSKACYFIENNIGYETRYDVPSARAATDVILLERIINATELKPPPPPPDPNSIKLSESYPTPNGLLTAHYPADFAASKLDDSTIVLSRNADGAEADVVTLGAVASPITKDLREFARIMHALTEKNVVGLGGGGYTRTSDKDANCLGTHAGREIAVRYDLPPAGEYVSYSCFFFEKNRAYVLRYDLPASRVEQDAALLRRIVDATELKP